MNQSTEQEITFNTFSFYTDQIRNTLHIYHDQNSNLFLLRDPIYSFFSGQNLNKEHFDKYKPTFLSEGHLFYFLTHENFCNFISIKKKIMNHSLDGYVHVTIIGQITILCAN